MFWGTIAVEEARNSYDGLITIRWRCINCNNAMTLPQYQNFKYCLHCGRKVTQKIGGHNTKNN